jgi:hypothetical protein
MYRVSPSLMRFVASIFFFAVGWFSFVLMGKIFGFEVDISLGVNEYGLKGTILVIVSLLLAVFIGIPTGLFIGGNINVKTAKTDFIISAFWHYLANGTILWVFSWWVYIAIIGRNLLEDNLFATLVLIFLPLICFPGVTFLLLITEVLNIRRPPKINVCLVFLIPLVMWMCHFQQKVLLIRGSAWIIMGIVIPVVLVFISTAGMAKDMIQGEQMNKNLT